MAVGLVLTFGEILSSIMWRIHGISTGIVLISYIFLKFFQIRYCKMKTNSVYFIK